MNHSEWFSKDYDVKICDDVLFWKQDGGLVTATTTAWLMKLYPAKWVLFVKWLFNIEIIKKIWIDTQQEQ